VQTPVIVPADVAFMLVATALVLLMTPALAFFYGGLVRSKNALNTMMMSVAALGFVGVAWALLGYSLSFAEGGPLVGDLSKAFLNGVGLDPVAPVTIPQLLFMCASRLTWSSSRSGASSSTARSRTGSGAAASSPSSARSTSPAARSCT
jgi:hypothetical protein